VISTKYWNCVRLLTSVSAEYSTSVQIKEKTFIKKSGVRCNIVYQPSAASRKLTNIYITYENTETSHMSCHK